MLIRDIIDLCTQTARDAYVTDNERIDSRMWQDWIMLKRNTYIKNYINEKGTLEQNTLQFEILSTEKYDPAFSIAGASIGNYITRTELCPSLIEARSGMAIYELTSPDILSKTIQPVAFERLRWCGNGKVNKDVIFAAFYDGRFYLKSKSDVARGISKMRVVAAFADPMQVSTYNRETDDYPCNDYMIEYIKNAILQSDFNITNQTKADEMNDGSGRVEGSKLPSQPQNNG